MVLKQSKACHPCMLYIDITCLTDALLSSSQQKNVKLPKRGKIPKTSKVQALQNKKNPNPGFFFVLGVEGGDWSHKVGDKWVKRKC